MDKVFNHIRAMVKRDHRVIRYIPKQMYTRFRAIESIAYHIRQDEGLKTRVKIGHTDFLLSTRAANSSIWHSRYFPSNLPEIEIDQIRNRPSRFQVRSSAVESEQSQVAEVVQNTI